MRIIDKHVEIKGIQRIDMPSHFLTFYAKSAIIKPS